MGHSEVLGGAPYGATTIAGGDGSRQPSETDLAGARYQGRRIAEVAAMVVSSLMRSSSYSFSPGRNPV